MTEPRQVLRNSIAIDRALSMCFTLLKQSKSSPDAVSKAVDGLVRIAATMILGIEQKSRPFCSPDGKATAKTVFRVASILALARMCRVPSALRLQPRLGAIIPRFPASERSIWILFETEKIASAQGTHVWLSPGLDKHFATALKILFSSG